MGDGRRSGLSFMIPRWEMIIGKLDQFTVRTLLVRREDWEGALILSARY
jgi:hypothetical protein